MAKWLCRCGTTIRASGAIPNPSEWLLVSDVDYESVHDMKDSDDLYSAMTHAFRCPTCDRRHIFWNGLDQAAAVYAREGTAAHPE